MIAGLPIGTWVLMAAGTVPGLVLVVAAYRVHRAGDLGKGGGGSDNAAPEGRRVPGRGPETGGGRGPEAPQAQRGPGGDDG